MTKLLDKPRETPIPVPSMDIAKWTHADTRWWGRAADGYLVALIFNDQITDPNQAGAAECKIIRAAWWTPTAEELTDACTRELHKLDAHVAATDMASTWAWCRNHQVGPFGKAVDCEANRHDFARHFGIQDDQVDALPQAITGRMVIGVDPGTGPDTTAVTVSKWPLASGSDLAHIAQQHELPCKGGMSDAELRERVARYTADLRKPRIPGVEYGAPLVNAGPEVAGSDPDKIARALDVSVVPAGEPPKTSITIERVSVLNEPSPSEITLSFERHPTLRERLCNCAPFDKNAEPDQHEETCPVAPVAGVHGGLRLQPTARWELSSSSKMAGWYLDGAGHDYVSLRMLTRLFDPHCCTLGDTDMVLQGFYLPPPSVYEYTPIRGRRDTRMPTPWGPEADL